MIAGLGNCGICHRKIADFTPVKTVTYHGRAHIAHKSCELPASPLINQPDPAPPHEILGATPIVVTPASVDDLLKNKNLPSDQPSMPVKEQTGVRKAPAKKAPPKDPQ